MHLVLALTCTIVHGVTIEIKSISTRIVAIAHKRQKLLLLPATQFHNEALSYFRTMLVSIAALEHINFVLMKSTRTLLAPCISFL